MATLLEHLFASSLGLLMQYQPAIRLPHHVSLPQGDAVVLPGKPLVGYLLEHFLASSLGLQI